MSSVHYKNIISFNTLRPRQNCCRYANSFKRMFLNENPWISVMIPLRFVPKGPVNYISALFQIKFGADLAVILYLSQWWSSLMTHICITRSQWVKYVTYIEIGLIIFCISIKSPLKSLIITRINHDVIGWCFNSLWCGSCVTVTNSFSLQKKNHH